MKNHSTKSQQKRYIFIDFDNLKKIKFKKLEKVCDKVFIFIERNQDQIPFQLVKQIQKLGKDARWIEIDAINQKDIQFHICFYMGQMHNKFDKSTEFAVLSNDKAFDNLIAFINTDGRSCLRVKSKPEKEDLEHMDYDEFMSESQPLEVTSSTHEQSTITDDNNTQQAIDGEISESMIAETAKMTINRLVQSGNRPADLGMLRHYIMLHHQEIAVKGGVDQIIRKLEESEEIKVEGDEVTYNF